MCCSFQDSCVLPHSQMGWLHVWKKERKSKDTFSYIGSWSPQVNAYFNCSHFSGDNLATWSQLDKRSVCVHVCVPLPILPIDNHLMCFICMFIFGCLLGKYAFFWCVKFSFNILEWRTVCFMIAIPEWKSNCLLLEKLLCIVMNNAFSFYLYWPYQL